MATSIRMATRLAFYRLRRKPFYVLVQRGFPSLAVECGPSRRDIEQQILVVCCKQKSFRQWSRAAMLGAAKQKGDAGHGC